MRLLPLHPFSLEAMNPKLSVGAPLTSFLLLRLQADISMHVRTREPQKQWIRPLQECMNGSQGVETTLGQIASLGPAGLRSKSPCLPAYAILRVPNRCLKLCLPLAERGMDG